MNDKKTKIIKSETQLFPIFKKKVDYKQLDLASWSGRQAHQEKS